MLRFDAMTTAPSPETLGYAGALAELDTILVRLEDDNVDIDLLAADVERAASLIRFCRERIISARTDVERVVADLSGTQTSTVADLSGTQTSTVADLSGTQEPASGEDAT